MRARMIGAAALAALAVLAAGCGGSGSPAAQAVGGAASVVPSNAVAFVAVDTDASSAQWQTVNDLLAKFPAHDAWTTQLRQAFEQKTKLSWTNDVLPALGSELDLAVLPGTKPQLVGLTQPKDAAKLDALVTKLGHGLVTRTVGGWTAIADTGSALDALGSSPSLAQDNTYGEATAKLAGDALVKAYANGTEAQQLLATLHAGSAGQQPASSPLQWAAADLVAESDGVKAEVFARTAAPTAAQPQPTAPYAAQLPDEIPAGALLVADFQADPSALQGARTSNLPKPLAQLLQAHPNLLGEAAQVLGGESALYVSPGLPIPSATLVTSPQDPAAAVRALPDLVDALHQALGAAGGKRLPLDLANLPLYHAVHGGQLVVSTSQQAIADFESGGGARLSADGTFQEARQASAMPAQTTGFVYANVKDALPLLQTLGPLAGFTVPTGLEPLRTLTAYGTRSGDTASYTLFLEAR